MTVINLDAASWILAKAKIKLQVAASVSLDSHSLLLSDAQDLLTKDVWIHMGHDFHFSFRISFDSMSSIFGVPTENALTDFIASALTQAPFWSQLRLAPSLSVPGFTANCYRASSGRSIHLKLEPDSGSDYDLSNVKPPNGISPVSFKSVQVSLTFSQVLVPLERSHDRSKKFSPSFEDLLGPEYSHQIPDLDLKITNSQSGKHELLDDFEVLLDQSPCRPVALLYDVDDPLEAPRSFNRTNSKSLCLPQSNFHALKREDVALPGEQPSFRVTQTDRTATSSSVATFERLKPDATSSFHLVRQWSRSPLSPPNICIGVPPQQSLTFYQSILGLTDAALRTLIHPQPTRLFAGIKLSKTTSEFDPKSGHYRPGPATLSDIAPQIFTPGYAQAVVEGAPFVPSIAKSLARFLIHRCGPRPDKTYRAERQGRSKNEEGRGMQEEVKEMLRGHVWMTMVNGLRILHSEKVRRLQPLEMPLAWRKGNRVEDVTMTVEEDMEMLDGASMSCPPHPGHGEEHGEEQIGKGLESEFVSDIDDEFEEDLLLDEMEAEWSYLEEGLEGGFLSGKDADLHLGSQEVAGGEVGDETDCVDNVEEMLL